MSARPTYDVFLSHSSADKPAVERIAEKLTAAGLNPRLDKWQRAAGDPWQEELEKALCASRPCAVLIGPKGMTPWHNEEMRVAVNRRVTDPSRRYGVIPVWLPGARRGQDGLDLPDFLARTTWVEFHDTEDVDALHRLVCGIRGVLPWEEVTHVVRTILRRWLEGVMTQRAAQALVQRVME